MEIDFNELRNIEWGTNFHIVSKNNKSIRILFSELNILNKLNQNILLEFENPSNEWSSIWDEKKNKWIENRNLPDFEIEAFNVKNAGDLISLSFGGNIEQGFIRWGFYTSKISMK